MMQHDENTKAQLIQELHGLRRRIADLEATEAEDKHAEEALRNSKQRFLAAQRIAKMGDFTWDVESGEVTWSDALFDLLGYQKSDDIDYAKVNAEIHHPDDLGRVTQWLHACLASGQAELTPNEYRIIHKDGHILSVRTMGVIERQQGKSVKVFATIQDITERKKAEEKIQEQHEEIQLQNEELQVTNDELVETLQKLTLREQQYTLLFDNMANGVAIYQKTHDGEDFVFVDINKAGQTLSQVQKEHIIGKKVSEIFPAVKEMGLFSVFQRVWHTGKPEHHPLAIYKDTRIEQWVENYVYKLPTGHIVAIYHDITERKRAEEAINAQVLFLDTIMEQSPFAMWVSDTLGTVIRINRALREALNLTDEQIVGKYNVLQDDNLNDQGVMPQVRTVFEEHKSARFTISWSSARIDHADFAGAVQDLDIDVSMFPIVNSRGELEHVVCQWVDISDLKQAKDELQQHREHLEELVAQRTEELHAKNQELETFAYSVSHDLKAPLRGIDGYSRLLLDDYLDRLDEDGRLFLHNIRHAARQMNQLIEDLLTYSRLERQTLKTGQVNLPHLLEELLAERANDITERRVRLTIELPFHMVMADASSLTQVLRNLLDNALKFTETVAETQIEIGGEENAETQRLWVRDNGVGFDMQYHSRIFEIFQRLHRAEDFPGTGIGLAIVRKALERMGGRVWAESQPGAGAIFYLEFRRKY